MYRDRATKKAIKTIETKTFPIIQFTTTKPRTLSISGENRDDEEGVHPGREESPISGTVGEGTLCSAEQSVSGTHRAQRELGARRGRTDRIPREGDRYRMKQPEIVRKLRGKLTRMKRYLTEIVKGSDAAGMETTAADVNPWVQRERGPRRERRVAKRGGRFDIPGGRTAKPSYFPPPP